METLTVIYDNRAIPPFRADWGFSVFLELEEENLLFDTGASPKILMENMELAGVKPSDIDKVFISHNHWDHVGGLPYIVDSVDSVEVYVPESDCSDIEEKLPEGSLCIPVSSPTYISERLLSTGIFPTGLETPSEEQALVVFTERGALLLTGCSHPGIVDIARRAVSLVGEQLFLILGGFHLKDSPREEVLEISEELKKFTQFIAPCHCTGEEAISLFKEDWGDRFIDAAAGLEIPLSED